MLEPSFRLLYLDELRPPDGWRLDISLATTYSLDLLSLLMAPLSMVLFECESREELLCNPLSALEALRRMANRLAFFCQRGRIIVPTRHHPLYTYLEPSVVEVQPPSPDGVFHPKIWVLRFSDPTGGGVLYRFICLSRNMTFDRSWDTALVLEGKLEKERKRVFARNRSLADFVAGLPGLAAEVPNHIRKIVETTAQEIPFVRFQAPEGFNSSDSEEDLLFVPLGVPSGKKMPFFKDCKRLLAVSPFLSEGWLNTVIKNKLDLTLVSRFDSLNSISENLYKQLTQGGAQVYTLDETAEGTEEFFESSNVDGSSGEQNEEEIEDDEALEFKTEEDLSGLHAKLYLAEYSSKEVDLWTGSANATNPGFGGENVEFMVRLTGTKAKIGIDKILGGKEDEEDLRDDGPGLFLSLLRPYQRPASITTPDPEEKRLEDLLAKARKVLARSQGRILASAEPNELYSLRIEFTTCLDTGPHITGICYPISLNKNAGKDILSLLNAGFLEFSGLPISQLTTFFAFWITARCGGKTATEAFVLKFPAEGFPDDRDSRILHSILRDPDEFLKYLLLLLADKDRPSAVEEMLKALRKDPNAGRGLFSIWGLPLFEEMVRAFSRDPEKIDRIVSLVEDLQKYTEGQNIIPPDFLNLWDTFLLARSQKDSVKNL